MNFTDFNLNDNLNKALIDLEFVIPTPIQENAIPYILDNKDLIGIAQTGTGKTAAFSLPILNSFLSSETKTKEMYPRALILAPTRELCAQIGKNMNDYSKYTDIKTLVTYGGVSPEPQIEALKESQDILIATPGRLIDLVEQRNVFLDDVEFFVLDEADRIIQQGLQADLKKIMKKLPKTRHSLFFSATMNKEIKPIAAEILREPVIVEIESEEKDLKLIDQNVLFTLKENKIKTLINLLKLKEVKSAIIFTNLKQTTDDLIRSLHKNEIKAEALHSGKSNTHREKIIRHIEERSIKVVVATDLASRGLDFEHMTHVINYEIPRDFETYTHRVGRIGRASKKGTAFSICGLDERNFFKKIEENNKYPIRIVNHEFHSNMVKTNGGNKHLATHRKPVKKKGNRNYSNRKGK